MQARKFDKEKDYKEICEWFRKRNINSPSIDMLSDSGVIVDNVACGFLYLTDSSLSFIDFYISNPLSSKQKRSQALELITTNLIMWAKETGASHIMCNSQIRTIQDLAFKYDFKSYGFSLTFMKEL